jgi:hypothetical protein
MIVALLLRSKPSCNRKNCSMQTRPMALAAGLLLCVAVSIAASDQLNVIDAPVIGPQNQRIRCILSEKAIIKQMRPLLRKLLLSMVSLQLCQDHANRDICTTPPSTFQRHHHCRLLSLLQRYHQTCTNELLCKQRNCVTSCSLEWQSNVAALQWLFPKHMYCSNSQFKKVPGY